VIPVRPQPNIYTVLLFVCIIAIGVAMGFCLYTLTTPLEEGGYGLEFFKHILQPEKNPLPPPASP
jgi:hypothetical protein